MLGHVRTLGAGVLTLAVCIMLASLSWQMVLLGFALASVVWALWSCSAQLEQSKPTARNLEKFDRPRRVRRPADMYNFPATDWGNEVRPY